MATAKESGEADLYPIAVLIDELKHEDKNIRLRSMNAIQTIGKYSLREGRTKHGISGIETTSISTGRRKTGRTLR